MDEKDRDMKIAIIHSLAGIALGLLTGLYFHGPKFSLINVIILGLALSYPLMLLTKKLYWPDMEFKDWLGKGFYLFFSFWIVIWTFIYNI